MRRVAGMLILTRKVGQKVMIGDNVEIEVLGIKGSFVRLGIQAPKNVKVLRNEVLEKDKKTRDNS